VAAALDNFKEIWRRTSLVQRVLLLGIVLGFAGAGFFLVNWARQPELAILYTSLDPEQAAKVADKVRDQGVPYELTNGGTTIMVPSEKVYSLRLVMAGQGLPKSDQSGYRILDEEKLGASPFTQRINYNRAIEGELAKSIEMIEGVVNARVHVAQPESSLFADKDKQATATVVLAMRNGARMTPANVGAIVHLVAGSVESLSPDKVVVVDSQGTLLSGEGGSNELGKKAGTLLDYKGQVEEYLAKKAQDMLTAALGPGRATVRVDATVDTISSTTTTETYDPEKRVITKEETTSSSTPPADPKAAAGGKEEKSTNEYMVSKTTEQKTEIPGQVKSLTVAAFVDLTPPAKGADNAAPAALALTIADVQTIIRNAIGPLATEQNIKVVNTPFYRPPPATDQQAQEDAQSKRQLYLDIAGRGSLGLLVIGSLVALKLIRSPRKESTALASLGSDGVPGQPQAALAAVDSMDPQVLRARITRALQENPEEVKRLFMNWVESDKGEA
jgi:flagellar M-ring protein FliF